MVRAGQLLQGEGSLSWEGGTFSSKPQLPGPASLPAFATVGSLQVCGEKTATLRCCLSISQLTSLLTSRVRTLDTSLSLGCPPQRPALCHLCCLLRWPLRIEPTKN